MKKIELQILKGKLTGGEFSKMVAGITQQRLTAVLVNREQNAFRAFVLPEGMTLEDKTAVVIEAARDEQPLRFYGRSTDGTVMLTGTKELVVNLATAQLQQLEEGFAKVIGAKTGQPTERLHLVTSTTNIELATRFGIGSSDHKEWSKPLRNNEPAVVVHDYQPKNGIVYGVLQGMGDDKIVAFDASKGGARMMRIEEWSIEASAPKGEKILDLSRIKLDRNHPATAITVATLKDKQGTIYAQQLTFGIDGSLAWGQAVTSVTGLIGRYHFGTQGYGFVAKQEKGFAFIPPEQAKSFTAFAPYLRGTAGQATTAHAQA